MTQQKNISSTFSGPADPLTDFPDGFEAYRIGPLGGQGEWTQPAGAQNVQSAVVRSGQQAVNCLPAAFGAAKRKVFPYPVGEASCYIRRGGDLGSSFQRVTFWVMDSLANQLGAIGLHGANLKYMTNGSLVTLFTPVVLDVWYRVSIQWRNVPSPQVRYRYNAEAWTAWMTRAQVASVSPSGFLELEYYSLSATHLAFFDDVYFFGL